MSAARARLFIALDLPPAVRTSLNQWGSLAATTVRAAGGKPRLVDSQALHITICFLGSRPVQEIDPLCDAVRALTDTEVGMLSLGAPLWLPPRRPRVLAVEVHDGRGDLADLHKKLRLGLGAICELQNERRRFRPHVTVARMGRGDTPGERALTATPALEFSPHALVLYRSWLSPEGATYEPLERALLAG
ncbi:MAG: RNA 2',3'-cyclic phosphodiesterase [Solirubrobacteraceae bacterium]